MPPMALRGNATSILAHSTHGVRACGPRLSFRCDERPRPVAPAACGVRPLVLAHGHPGSWHAPGRGAPPLGWRTSERCTMGRGGVAAGHQPISSRHPCRCARTLDVCASGGRSQPDALFILRHMCTDTGKVASAGPSASTLSHARGSPDESTAWATLLSRVCSPIPERDAPRRHASSKFGILILHRSWPSRSFTSGMAQLVPCP